MSTAIARRIAALKPLVAMAVGVASRRRIRARSPQYRFSEHERSLQSCVDAAEVERRQRAWDRSRSDATLLGN